MAPAKTALHRITCAGLSYRQAGAEHPTEFALRGELIELDADEAKRLIELDAVVPDGDPDPVIDGGREHAVAMKRPEDHAAEERAKAATGEAE